MSNNQTQEPEGIAFFSIRTGETHYCKLEPTITAYINSSDMGINASHGQDYGWRLSKIWVQATKTFKRNKIQMSILTAKLAGQSPTIIQILYHIYGEQLQNYYEDQEDNENSFEEDYLRSLAENGVEPTQAQPSLPQALTDFLDDGSGEDEDSLANVIDDAIEDEDSLANVIDDAIEDEDKSELARAAKPKKK